MTDKAEWLRRRRMGIGSSDAASIHAASPYMTELELYNDKVGIEKAESNNFIKDKGNEYEPKARAQFEADWNSKRDIKTTFQPIELTHLELSFLKANLDGLSEDRETFIEIKFVGKDIFESEIIPKHYWMQIQHQYLVSGAKQAYFVFFIMKEEKYPSTDNPFATRTVMHLKSKFIAKDEMFLKEHVAKCAAFWNRVSMRNPPPPSDKDYIELNGYDDLIKQYAALKRQADELETLLSKAKEKLISVCTHPRMKRGNVRIQQITQKGTINYKDLLNEEEIKNAIEENGIDIESFRAPEKSFFKISVND